MATQPKPHHTSRHDRAELTRSARSTELEVLLGPDASCKPLTLSAKGIEHCPLFAGIAFNQRREIVRAAHARKFLRGEIIYRQGESVGQQVLLVSGCAKLVQFSPDGAEVILRLCVPGELVGLEGVSIQHSHCATAQALQSCEAAIWPMTTFSFLCQQFSRLSLNSVNILRGQLEEMEERFAEISTQHVPSRLSRQLVRLINQVGYQKNGTVVIHISREGLGQLTGISLYTVSRLLSEWQRKGILRARRKEICIPNPEALQCLHSLPTF